MSEELRNQLLRGEKIMNLLKQPKFSPISATELNERFKYLGILASSHNSYEIIKSKFCPSF